MCILKYQLATTCVAVFNSVLQCITVCCSLFQRIAVCILRSQPATTCVAVCCSVLQCIAVYCSVLQRVSACCSAYSQKSARDYIDETKWLSSWLFRIFAIASTTQEIEERYWQSFSKSSSIIIVPSQCSNNLTFEKSRQWLNYSGWWGQTLAKFLKRQLDSHCV